MELFDTTESVDVTIYKSTATDNNRWAEEFKAHQEEQKEFNNG